MIFFFLYFIVLDTCYAFNIQLEIVYVISQHQLMCVGTCNCYFSTVISIPYLFIDTYTDSLCLLG